VAQVVGSLLNLFGLAPKVAIAADSIARAFRGDDAGTDSLGGLGPLAPSIADQDRASEHAMAEDERVRANRQYLGVRNDYFKRRAGARVLDPDGNADELLTPAQHLALRAKFDGMPDLVRSEEDARLDARGVVRMPHRSVHDARQSTLDTAADDGDQDEWFRDTVTRDPIHAQEKRHR
jgi:hypothetical protein